MRGTAVTSPATSRLDSTEVRVGSDELTEGLTVGRIALIPVTRLVSG